MVKHFSCWYSNARNQELYITKGTKNSKKAYAKSRVARFGPKIEIPPVEKTTAGILENLKKVKNLYPYFKPPIMSSGLTHSSNCSEVSKPKLKAADRRLVPSLCAFLAIAAAFS